MYNEKRKVINGLTCPLLVKADGEKMGKTASGTLWVSRSKTEVYDFYQMFINSADEDVERLLSFFSDIEIIKIKEMCETNIIEAKKVMAFEVTKLVHGEEEALKAKTTSDDIFSKGLVSSDMPSIEMNKEDFLSSDLFTLLSSSLNISKGEARRLSEQGGIRINNEKELVNREMLIEDIKDNSIVIRKGKKVFLKIKIKETIS